MISIYTNARSNERFHFRTGPPVVTHHFDWGWLRRTSWRCGPDKFTSWWFFGHLQLYHGVKCDGSRTYMGWNGQLSQMGEKVAQDQYVMTTTPSERFALRWRAKGPGAPTWDNMGGS